MFAKNFFCDGKKCGKCQLEDKINKKKKKELLYVNFILYRE